MHALLALLTVLALALPARAEAIKVGIGTSAGGHLYLARDRGYFAAEGLEVEFIPFPAAEPVAVALVAGSIDFGATGVSAALYNFGGQDLGKIIAGSLCQASATDLAALKDIGSHSVVVRQIDAPSHYAAALIAEKYGVDLKTVRILP